MPDDNISGENMTGSRPTDRSVSEISYRDRPATTKLPIQETQQPDPMLQMSTGRMGVGGLTLVALVVALVLGVVFYGLNGRSTAQQTAAAPPAVHSTQPAAGGNSGAATPSAPRANESGVKG